MRHMIYCGFNVHYGKKNKWSGISATITDSSERVGKNPFFIITCNQTDADSRARLLIAVGQEIRYLEIQEINPSEPNEEIPIEVKIQ